jgi:uracil phosphoribosyltransferase
MVHIFDHPLIKTKLSSMRSKDTHMVQFRQYLEEISLLMVYEITRNEELIKINIETPICQTVGFDLKNPIVLVPILRAGLGMVDGVKKLIPSAVIGHIGLYRDETTRLPQEYYFKVPILANADYFIFDPMLATGGSAVAAITMLKNKGASHIKLVCLVGVDEGINKVKQEHPDVDIYLAAKDEKLNDFAYIVPGLGDAGDRLFGTK